MLEWTEFKSHTEMINACQIPDELLANMCTHGLIVTYLNYPLIGDISAYNIRELGYNSVKNSFNGLAELHKRPDVLPELKEYYNNFDLRYIVESWDQGDSYNSIDTRMDFHLAGMIIYQTDILSQGHNEMWPELIRITLDKHDYMAANNHVSWWSAYQSNSTIMGRIMIMSDFSPFKKVITDDPYLYRLIKNGCQHASYDQVLEIVDYARQFVNNLEE